jgi:hypothetical protein
MTKVWAAATQLALIHRKATTADAAGWQILTFGPCSRVGLTFQPFDHVRIVSLNHEARATQPPPDGHSLWRVCNER